MLGDLLRLHSAQYSCSDGDDIDDDGGDEDVSDNGGDDDDDDDGDTRSMQNFTSRQHVLAKAEQTLPRLRPVRA